jgi:hypothetical protein
MYFLFGYDRYYPSGGMNDYVGSTDCVEDAQELAKQHPRDLYEIVTSRDGDLASPAHLEIILTGSSKCFMRSPTVIEWEKEEYSCGCLPENDIKKDGKLQCACGLRR